MIQNHSQAALDYLKLTDYSRQFPPFLLKILMEDHCKVRAERIRNNRILDVLQYGDIVVAQIAIQSDHSKKK